MNFFIYISLFTNLIMLGVSLITHFVTYPSFKLIKSSIFSKYHRSYTYRMLFIVAPIMTLELSSTLLLVILFDTINNYTALSLLITLIIIWLLTFFNIVPLHNKLSIKYNNELNKKLIRYNGLRTCLWTIKLILFVGFCNDLTANFH